MRSPWLLSFLAVLTLALSGCDQDDTSAIDIDATVEAAVQATLARPQPTDTPSPDLEATVSAGVEATIAAQQAVGADQARERPYRNYPAPTGLPGFRLYYQKRCYPGCHTYGTPTPGGVHP
jgi:hypothetical protein